MRLKFLSIWLVGLVVASAGVACKSKGEPAPVDAGEDGFADAGGDSDPGDTGPDGADQVADIDWASLNGSVPDEALAAPVFSVTNRDGAPRTRDDLIGQPTVLWFYPKAATSG